MTYEELRDLASFLYTCSLATGGKCARADGAVLSVKKCVTRKDLPILLVLMNLRQKIPVGGRFFNKELIIYAFFMKKRGIT